MRRRLSTLITILVGLWLTSVPALATEGEEAAASDEGQWTGLILTAVVAIAFGVVVYFELFSGEDEAAHHGDH